jgi:glycosyltransferase involved in cell wall biosynthesis
MGNRVLVISYYFPPDRAIGGKRIAAFCRHLPAHGFEPTVLTVDEGSCVAVDPTVVVPLGTSVVRVKPHQTPLEWYRRNKNKWGADATMNTSPVGQGDGAKSAPAVSRSWLRKNLLATLWIPDAKWGWYLPAVKAGRSIIERMRPDIILSSGPPWTVHSVASSLSRKFSLPWVADFRDAWVSDPWRVYAQDSQGVPKWRDKVDYGIEDRWLQTAALTVCATQNLRATLLSTHPTVPAEKLEVISNGFEDLEIAKTSSKGKPGPRTLLHTGSLYGGRRIDTFCKAFELLAQSNAEAYSDLKLTFLGYSSQAAIDSAKASAPNMSRAGSIEFLPSVNWAEALERISQASVLLVFQGEHPTAIPAKFFEYLQTGNPIVAIAGEGALRDVVEATASGVVASPDDVEAIRLAIRRALETPRKSPEEVERISRPYNFRNLAADLASHIREIIG